jgi:hypothetical protein
VVIIHLFTRKVGRKFLRWLCALLSHGRECEHLTEQRHTQSFHYNLATDSLWCLICYLKTLNHLTNIVTIEFCVWKQEDLYLLDRSEMICVKQSYIKYFPNSITGFGNNIQHVPGGKINILGGHSNGHSKQKVCMFMCCIPNGSPDTYFTVQLYSTDEQYRCTQTNNTTCSHTSCKVHWCWRWNFRKCVILCKLYQLCRLNNKHRYQTKYIIFFLTKNFGTLQ